MVSAGRGNAPYPKNKPEGVFAVSTNDVPGANPKNQDILAMGCWRC